ncbi:hypothetical protein Y88_3081 [Novosphingobium nitrogenifigens DSM 19370]|uniref:Uncharacterized protein n=1 Tax=Novosphingobium nitrogenifigens DSM 19370 TaxID=983920 RepID=F1ZCG5_9SPHN|nr:hypothetical protein Y88_3081 [Novosphingobium nitrogenifigens DSM 19370]
MATGCQQGETAQSKRAEEKRRSDHGGVPLSRGGNSSAQAQAITLESVS